MLTSRRHVLTGLAGAVFASATTASKIVFAQSSRPISLVVGYPPGGLTDSLARLFAAEFSKKINRQVIVENRPGANGNIATTYVANASPNGDVMLFANGSQIVINPNIYPSLKPNPAEELTHLGLVGSTDFAVATPTATGLKSMQALIEQAKQRPGQLAYGTPGIGGYSHVLHELLKSKANINIRPIHYRGSSLLIPDLLTNQVQMAIEAPALIREHVEAGKLTALMIVGSSRSKLLPDVPTVSEAGLNELDPISSWWGLHASKKMPATVAFDYEKALQATISSPEYIAKVEANGVLLQRATQADFEKRVLSEFALFASVTKSANITAE